VVVTIRMENPLHGVERSSIAIITSRWLSRIHYMELKDLALLRTAPDQYVDTIDESITWS
ncbi:MAG: hypothetical protein ACO2OZ_05255, partial [Acidilobaceae archaeon]